MPDVRENGHCNGSCQCRRRSEDIEDLLGYRYGDEVIHRNDLVLAPRAAENIA